MNKYVLSCDAGGIKGLIVLKILANIEETTGKQIYELFDLFVGTSISSLIVAMLLYKKIKAKDIINKYFNHKFLESLFNTNADKIIRELAIKSQTRTIKLATKIVKFCDKIRLKNKYNFDKKAFYDDEFKDLKISSVTDKKIILPVFDCKRNQPILIKNYDTTDNILDMYLRDVCYMATSVPGIFPIIPNEMWGIDGALFRCNPCDIAYSEAIKLWGSDCNINILSLGTGYKIENNIGEHIFKWGTINWLAKGSIVERILNSSKEMSYNIVETISKCLNHNILRLDISITESEVNDGMLYYYNTLHKLSEYGDNLWELKKEEINKFIQDLLNFHQTHNQ